MRIVKIQRVGPFQHHSRSDIAHLHMRIVKIERVGRGGFKRGKSTSFLHFHKRQELGHEKSGK